jgi:hypothetical protein
MDGHGVKSGNRGEGGLVSRTDGWGDLDRRGLNDGRRCALWVTSRRFGIVWLVFLLDDTAVLCALVRKVRFIVKDIEYRRASPAAVLPILPPLVTTSRAVPPLTTAPVSCVRQLSHLLATHM